MLCAIITYFDSSTRAMAMIKFLDFQHNTADIKQYKDNSSPPLKLLQDVVTKCKVVVYL